MAKRRCRYCGRWFIPDPRVGDRQEACSVSCQKLRKKENNRVFSANNPGYWSDPHRYEYLRQWRQRHPDYQRRWLYKKKAEKKMSSGEIQAEREIKTSVYRGVMKAFSHEIQVHIAFGDALIENLLRISQRIHKRLPVGFVEKVLKAFNAHRISEKEAMGLFGLWRSRLHQLPRG